MAFARSAGHVCGFCFQCYGADHLFRFGVRLCGRYGTDALWAYSIWNNPEMGQYLPDEAKEEIDDEYLKMLEGLGEDKECCYLTPVFKNSNVAI